jgi:hypothetical protein
VSPPLRPRPSPVAFRPQFTLLVIYFFVFFVFFCFVLALPDLVAGARALPPSSGPLTDAEREAGARIAAEALRGKLPLALAGTVAALALGAWTRALPGLRRR